MNNLKVHWLNGLLAICLAGASAFAMNWRDWHPGVFTGWTFIGFGLLALGAALTGGLLVMSLKGDSKWTTPVAFLLGLATGIGGVFFFQEADMRWQESLAGLLVFAVIGGLIAGIAFTKWNRP